MAHSDNQDKILEHHRRHSTAERVEGGIRYSLNDVQPLQGQSPQPATALDRVADNLHRAAHRFFTRNKNTE